MCCSSVTHLCPILCNLIDCSMPGSPVLHYLQEFAQTHVHGVQEFAQTHVHGCMVDAIQPSHPLFSVAPLLLLPSMFPSIRVFSNESALCIRWPTYWRFRFSTSPSNEYSGLISFRIDWFDLLVVQGTLQQSSPAPQFESINSLVLSFFYANSHIRT